MIFHRTWKIDFGILISSISMRSYECMSSIFAFERRKSLLFLSSLWIRRKGDSIQKRPLLLPRSFLYVGKKKTAKSSLPEHLITYTVVFIGLICLLKETNKTFQNKQPLNSFSKKDGMMCLIQGDGFSSNRLFHVVCLSQLNLPLFYHLFVFPSLPQKMERPYKNFS